MAPSNGARAFPVGALLPDEWSGGIRDEMATEAPRTTVSLHYVLVFPETTRAHLHSGGQRLFAVVSFVISVIFIVKPTAEHTSFQLFFRRALQRVSAKRSSRRSQSLSTMSRS